MSAVEAQIGEISASLKQVGDQLKAYAEKSEKEIKAHAQLSEETKAKVDTLLTEQGGLKAQLQAAEQALAKLERGEGTPAKPQSLGQRFADEEQVKAYKSSVQGSSVTMKVGSIHAAITSSGASGGDLIVPQRVPGIVAAPQQRLFIRDLLNWGRTESNSVEFVRETGFTNNAAPVSENPANPKPESDITFEADSEKVVTVAHFIRASKQIMDDVAQLPAYIDGRLLYGLKLKEELQLFKGSGAGLNIHGIKPQASAYANPGVTVMGETAIDRLRIALLQVQLAEYEADGIVLNPIDWASIELTKDKNLSYLIATPHGVLAPGLWGRPVVPTNAQDIGDFLVGAFQLGAQGWDREDASITVSNQDRDNFVKNMVTILCEERVALTVTRPEAFVSGDFSGLPASV